MPGTDGSDSHKLRPATIRVVLIATVTTVLLAYAALSPVIAEVTAKYSPSPQAAPADKPSSYFNGCHGSSLQTEPRACDFGDVRGKRRVLLLGDSHAAQLQPALHEFGSRNGVRVTVITKSSCPAADVRVLLPPTGPPHDTCAAWHRSLQTKLRARAFGTFDAAVISSFGNHIVLRPGTSKRLVGAARNTAWRDGTARILAELRRSAKRTIVVRAGPILRESTMSCLIRKYPNGSGCATPIAKALFPSTWQAEKMAVSRTAGATALDLSTPYCSGGVCRPVAGKYLAFRNSQHWGRTYSTKVLSIRLGTAVKKLMP